MNSLKEDGLMQEKKELSTKEIEERVAVLRRFKSLLQDKRDKFNEYLFVLEKQEESIAESNMEAIRMHTEIENNIIQSIASIQKVIEPIEKMYLLANPKDSDRNLLQLKGDLARLETAVLKQNEKNRLVLQEKMDFLRKEIASFSPKYSKSVYAKNEEVANYIDVSL